MSSDLDVNTQPESEQTQILDEQNPPQEQNHEETVQPTHALDQSIDGTQHESSDQQQPEETQVKNVELAPPVVVLLPEASVDMAPASYSRKSSIASSHKFESTHDFSVSVSSPPRAREINSSTLSMINKFEQPTTYKTVKDLETDNACFQEELAKFRKGQAAQRSLQWQFDEVSRLFGKLEGIYDQMVTDYTNVSKDKDGLKRLMKTLQKEVVKLNGTLDQADQERMTYDQQHTMILQEEKNRSDELQATIDQLHQDIEDMKADHARQCNAWDNKNKEAQRQYQSNLDQTDQDKGQLSTQINELNEKIGHLNGDISTDKKIIRTVKAELQEREHYLEDIKDQNQRLTTKLEESQRQVNDLKPWEVKYHGLYDRSQKSEQLLNERVEELSKDTRCLRVVLKYLIMKTFHNNIQLRTEVCSAHGRISSLLLTVSSEVDKLRQISKPGALPKSEASPSVDITDSDLANRFISPESEVWEKTLHASIDRKRLTIKQMLTNIKAWPVSKLLESLDVEAAQLVEPVEVMIKRLWSYYQTCQSLGQSSIDKTSEYRQTTINYNELKRSFNKVQQERDEAILLKDREAQNNTALTSKLHILEREMAQINKNRKQAQSIETLLKEHSKLQNIQEHLLSTKRKIKLLQEEQQQQDESLKAMQQRQNETGGRGNRSSRKAHNDDNDSELDYTMHQSGARNNFTPTQSRKVNHSSSSRLISPYKENGNNSSQRMTQRNTNSQDFNEIGDHNASSSSLVLPRVASNQSRERQQHQHQQQRSHSPNQNKRVMTNQQLVFLAKQQKMERLNQQQQQHQQSSARGSPSSKLPISEAKMQQVENIYVDQQDTPSKRR